MSAWTAKAERGSEWLIRLIAWLARTAGRPLCRAMLWPIVTYFWLSDREARQASADFLLAVHGRPPRWYQVFAHIHSFAATLLDRVYMAMGQFERFVVSIEGLPLVDRALQTGKGCLMLGSHLGSFDLMMLAHRAMDGRPISVMMRIDPRARLRRIAGIDDRSLDLIPLGRPESFLRAYEVLTRGGIVAVLADRVDGAAHLKVRFLGRTTAMPVAPHVLAARSGATVLMCFGIYEGGNHYRIEFVDFGLAAPPATRGDALQPTVQRYAALLERYATRYPMNWFNFYAYWGAEEESREERAGHGDVGGLEKLTAQAVPQPDHRAAHR
jgi:predicted LPLAT superfamily acyltransferase